VNLEVRDALITVLDAGIPTVSNRVYYGIAPSDAIFPYIVLHSISDRRPNQAKKREHDVYFSVRCVSPNLTTAKTLEEAVVTLFDNTSVETTNWVSYRFFHVNSYSFLEQQERIQVYKEICDFRLTIQAK